MYTNISLLITTGKCVFEFSPTFSYAVLGGNGGDTWSALTEEYFIIELPMHGDNKNRQTFSKFYYC